MHLTPSPGFRRHGRRNPGLNAFNTTLEGLLADSMTLMMVPQVAPASVLVGFARIGVLFALKPKGKPIDVPLLRY